MISERPLQRARILLIEAARGYPESVYLAAGALAWRQ